MRQFKVFVDNMSYFLVWSIVERLWVINMEKLKAKGIMDFIAEDGSLTTKITYEEFKNKEAAPDNSDDEIKEAFEAYCTILNR